MFFFCYSSLLQWFAFVCWKWFHKWKENPMLFYVSQFHCAPQGSANSLFCSFSIFFLLFCFVFPRIFLYSFASNFTFSFILLDLFISFCERNAENVVVVVITKHATAKVEIVVDNPHTHTDINTWIIHNSIMYLNWHRIVILYVCSMGVFSYSPRRFAHIHNGIYKTKWKFPTTLEV